MGAVLGLSQIKIKKLFAYSTVSHLGFILLTIVINKSEAIQAFVFYLTQYSLSNINAFFIIIAIGYTLYPFVNKQLKDIENKVLLERNNTPVQYINELKGYFYINPVLSISLSITLFSFAGIPPMIGFFAKQMVLSTALDSGYIFISLVAILTSVVSAGYYLNVIKQVFFDEKKLQLYKYLKNALFNCKIIPFMLHNNSNINNKFGIENIIISTFFTIIISILTLIILLFMFSSNE